MSLLDAVKRAKKLESDSSYTEKEFLNMIEAGTFVDWFNQLSDSEYPKVINIMRELRDSGKVIGYIEHIHNGDNIFPIVSSLATTSQIVNHKNL